MSTYTTPFWKAIEYAGDNGLNDYPIFDEVYRESLNQRILEHYDEQEIGIESPIRFVFALRRKMHEVMPKYNKLYESERLVIDPLNTVNMKSTSSSHADTSTTQTVDANGVTDNIHDGTVNATSSGSSNTTTHDESDTTSGTDSTSDTTTHDESDTISGSDSTSDTTTHDVNDTDTTTNNRARTTNSAMPQGRLGGDKDYATSGTDVVSGVDTTVDSTNDGTSNTVDSSSQTTGVVSDGTSQTIDSSSQTTGVVSDGTNNTITGDTGNTITNDVGKSTTTNTTEGLGTSEENANSEETQTGWNGNQSEMLLKYRETFLNIDLMVIQELGELFMLLWNTSDDYENKGGFGCGY